MVEILIVEDNEGFRGMLQAILESGFPYAGIRTASEGVAALQRIEQIKPDLIFMDIRLPGGSGLALTRQIKRLNPDIAIVIVTSLDTPEYRKAAFDMGTDGFLSKQSMHPEDAREKVRDIIGMRQRQQEQKSFKAPACSLP